MQKKKVSQSVMFFVVIYDLFIQRVEITLSECYYNKLSSNIFIILLIHHCHLDMYQKLSSWLLLKG